MNVPNSDKHNPMNPNQHPKQHPSADLQPDLHVEEALRNFRLTMHTWSEHEITRRPATAVSQSAHAAWGWLLAPAVSWTAAAVLAVGAVGVPLGLHHHNAVLAGQRAAAEAHRQLLEQQQAAQLASTKVDDDYLLQHVDTDIAQDTPDAMQPLASLMSTSGNE